MICLEMLTKRLVGGTSCLILHLTERPFYEPALVGSRQVEELVDSLYVGFCLESPH